MNRDYDVLTASYITIKVNNLYSEVKISMVLYNVCRYYYYNCLRHLFNFVLFFKNPLVSFPDSTQKGVESGNESTNPPHYAPSVGL